MSRTLREKSMLKIAEYNKAEYYGNRSGRCLAVFDEDGAKALNMNELNNNGIIDVYVMAVAHASEQINTSSQLLIKYISLGEEDWYLIFYERCVRMRRYINQLKFYQKQLLR